MQRNLFSQIIILGIVSFIAACATQGGLKVTSEPEGAEVLVIESNGMERKLGQTPLNLEAKDFQFSENKILDMKIKKPGFVSERIVLDTMSFTKTVDVHLKMTSLVSWQESFQDPKATPYLTDIASLAAEVQSAALSKDLTNAEKLARMMISRYPHVSVGWTLMGNIYYLRKDIGQAIQSYEKALQIDPDNKATKEVLARLKGGVQ